MLEDIYAMPGAVAEFTQTLSTSPVSAVDRQPCLTWQHNTSLSQCIARALIRSLHWLPVKHRVTYKMAALTFKTMFSSTPAYLNDLIQTAVPVRPLRSSDAPLLNVPKTRTESARQSFSVAAPHTRNSLPCDVRFCRTV